MRNNTKFFIIFFQKKIINEIKKIGGSGEEFLHDKESQEDLHDEIYEGEDEGDEHQIDF